MSAMHFAGSLEIRKDKMLTLVCAGWPVCMSGYRADNAECTFERAHVTCKRCIKMLAEHDRTAAENASKGGPRG